MSQPERTESGKVTLEDLLRVKRAERPSPEFWVRFEQELRAKQLAAAIEKRPWWIAVRLPQLVRHLTRYQLPLGATAVLALGVVAFREFRPASSSTAPVTVASVNVPSAHAPVLATVDPLRTSDLLPSETQPGAPEAAPLQADAPRVASIATPLEPAQPAAAPAAAPIGPGGLMAMIPWAPQGVSFDEPAPRTVIGELPQVQFAHVIAPARYADFASNRVDVEHVVMPVRVSTPEAVPVALVVASAGATKPAAAATISRREIRRDRILSTLIADASADVERSRLSQVREAVANAMDEDGLYDTVRRLGMGGDRVTLKF